MATNYWQLGDCIFRPQGEGPTKNSEVGIVIECEEDVLYADCLPGSNVSIQYSDCTCVGHQAKI